MLCAGSYTHYSLAATETCQASPGPVGWGNSHRSQEKRAVQSSPRYEVPLCSMCSASWTLMNGRVELRLLSCGFSRNEQPQKNLYQYREWGAKGKALKMKVGSTYFVAASFMSQLTFYLWMWIFLPLLRQSHTYHKKCLLPK